MQKTLIVKIMDTDFKDIPGFPNYGVNNLAWVRNRNTGKILSPFLVNDYYKLSLCNNEGVILLKRSVIVAMAFLDHIPCGMLRVVDHRDDNKLNDIPQNLQVITQKENVIKSNKGPAEITKGSIGKSKKSNKWRYRVNANGKLKTIGYCSTEQQAKAAQLLIIKYIENGY